MVEIMLGAVIGLFLVMVLVAVLIIWQRVATRRLVEKLEARLAAADAAVASATSAGATQAARHLHAARYNYRQAKWFLASRRYVDAAVWAEFGLKEAELAIRLARGEAKAE